MYCSFMNIFGEWGSDTKAACDNIQLCAICMISRNPILNLNGLCPKTVLDYNYYIVTNDNHTIDYYEGYRASNIIRKNQTWMFVFKRSKNSSASLVTNIYDEGRGIYPIGRLNWHVYEPLCGMTTVERKTLSLSKCRFGEQFTCDSGSCIDIEGRCNRINDCDDESDEYNCELVKFTTNYHKEQPPKTHNISGPIHISTFIKIESIDFIDTIKMHVGLTFEINQKWNDPRLTFANLDKGGTNKVKSKTQERMWIPRRSIRADNALLGHLFPSTIEDVEIIATSDPLQMQPDDATQNILYDGARTTISSRKRYRGRFLCAFFLRYFPFDEQSCTVVLKLEYDAFNAAEFRKDGPGVIYLGPKATKGFLIRKTRANTSITGDYTYFNLTVKLDRVYTDQLISSFFPTILLWLLAYFTLFIHPESFNERIMVSATVLLVLTALLSSIKNEIPSTNDFKYITLWFLWYSTFIFSISIYHILLHQMAKEAKRHKILVNGKEVGVYEENVHNRKHSVNDTAKIIMLVSFVLFNILYFLLQTIL